METEAPQTALQKTGFRDLVQHEFKRRVETNSRYSLRAFARSLGIYHATLSALLAGQRPFTAKSIQAVGTALGLSPLEISRHLEETVARTHRTVATMFAVENDEYNLEARWQYDAILECLQLPEQSHDTRILAGRLGFTPAEVLTGLQLLERCGLIHRDENGRWITTKRNTSNILGPQQTSSARRRYQKDLLIKSQAAIEEVPIERRNHTSLTIAIDESDLPELKTIIRDYRRKILSFSQRKNVKPNQVYQLQVSLFPLTKEVPQ